MSARDDYPAIAVHTRHGGREGQECADALDEIDRLRRWKAEAIEVIIGWEAVWHAAGRVCPHCGEQELREFHEFYTDADLRKEWDAKPLEVTADYNCTCRACGYTFEFRHTARYDAVVEVTADTSAFEDAVTRLRERATAPAAPAAPWPAPRAADPAPPA